MHNTGNPITDVILNELDARIDGERECSIEHRLVFLSLKPRLLELAQEDPDHFAKTVLGVLRDKGYDLYGE